MPASDDEERLGYCASCREFHLLTRTEIPALDRYADVCQNCAGLGDEGLAWRLGGMIEDGKFGYEVPPDALHAPRKRLGRDRLAESLIMGDSSEDETAGFGPARLNPMRRLRVAWWRLRGWQD